jgi:superfamily II DNA or RNA helicase
MQLRDYQIDIINGAISILNRGKRPFVVSPTGSGKMVVIAVLAGHLGAKVLIVEHRVELIEQAVEKLKEIGEKPGIIMSGVVDPNPDSMIKVGMIQTINRRIGTFEWGSGFSNF